MKAFEDIKDSDIKKDIIIDGLMRSNGVYLLVSKPKVGKSMFALQLADYIANGKPFLGYKVLKPSPVLYITTEVDSGQLKGRCELLGISFNKSSFFVIDRDNKSKINMMDIEYQIQEFAHEYNGKILIIDMLKDVDLNRCDDKGKPVYPVNTITSTIKQIPELAKSLVEAEKAVNKEIIEEGRARGGNNKTLFDDGINL